MWDFQFFHILANNCTQIHLRKWKKLWCLSFWVWLVVLNIIISSSLHFLANVMISLFLWLDKILLFICIIPYYLNLFLCWWAFRLVPPPGKVYICISIRLYIIQYKIYSICTIYLIYSIQYTCSIYIYLYSMSWIHIYGNIHIEYMVYITHAYVYGIYIYIEYMV